MCVHCPEDQWKSMEKTDETPAPPSVRAEAVAPELGKWHDKTWQTISIKVASQTGVLLEEDHFVMGPKIKM